MKSQGTFEVSHIEALNLTENKKKEMEEFLNELIVYKWLMYSERNNFMMSPTPFTIITKNTVLTNYK